MKVLEICPEVVPPLTLSVTFETEAEMREFRKLTSNFLASGPTDLIYRAVGDHLDTFTGRRFDS